MKIEKERHRNGGRVGMLEIVKEKEKKRNRETCRDK